MKRLINKRIAIDGIVGSYSSRISSHKASWPHLLKSKLFQMGIDDVTVLTKHDDLEEYDVLLISLPMEFQGSFNVFGGANDELAERLMKIGEFGGETFVADTVMPDVGAFIESRQKSCSDLFSELDPEDYTYWSESIKTIDTTLLNSNGFVLGDSHCISVYRPGYNISRNDGLTLHGALKQGLRNLIPRIEIKNLVLYFGNIDIRHHLMRREDLKKDLYTMLEDYEKQIQELKIEKIYIIAPLWIENESRKLPKTGYYKDTPFYGSTDERQSLVNFITRYLQDMCSDNGWKLIRWPDKMLNEDGELDFKYMEKPKSVHLSREFYHYDFDNNCINKEFLKLIQ